MSKITSLRNIYLLLLKHYGTQLWWPTTQTGHKLPSYCGGPRTRKQQLEVIIGAILTQNTSWKNVEKSLIELNRHELISIRKLLDCPQAELASLIRSSGYFNQKAKKLRAMAKFLLANPIRILERLETNHLRVRLLSIYGVGPETADSILLYAFSRDKFVVDAYTKRIFNRLGFVDENVSYEDLQSLFELKISRYPETFNEYHALIVRHGKDTCRPRPRCSECPLWKLCPSAQLQGD